MPSTHTLLRAVGVLTLAASCLHAQQFRTGTVAKRYEELCANCHGKEMEGAQAPSMLDDIWVHGGDDESLARSIRNGFPDKGMPAWSAALPEKEIRAMVIFIRETRAKKALEGNTQTKRVETLEAQTKLHKFKLNTWVGGLSEPWSMAFLPGNRAVVTEKKGRILVIENGKLAEKPLTGVPEADTNGQAGFFDLVPHPDYAKNGWLYLAFSHMQERDGRKVSLTKIVRGRIRDGAFADQEKIFEAPVEFYPYAGGVHFGGRIVFDGKGHLFFTIGERGNGANAQNLKVPMGKVHRIMDDGRVPADNPFVKDGAGFATIWSYGHRNPQGLAMNAQGELYDAEHGPRGGDEVNYVRPGLNYGWPVITYGMNYDGTAMTDITAKEGMEQPVLYYTPSIAPCGLNFYQGDLFPKWKGQAFLASLAGQELRRLDLRGNKLAEQEVIFKGIGRIRHVIGGPDGALYVLLPDRVARIAPAE